MLEPILFLIFIHDLDDDLSSKVLKGQKMQRFRGVHLIELI